MYLFSIISDSGPASQNPGSVKKLIFCTGRVYYDIVKARKDKGLESEIAVSTVEQVRKYFWCKIEINLQLFIDFTLPI